MIESKVEQGGVGCPADERQLRVVERSRYRLLSQFLGGRGRFRRLCLLLRFAAPKEGDAKGDDRRAGANASPERAPDACV